ncbi:MAG: hypothetical protein KF773_39930 [Deltaproteobacteria bacterium]|nr:hypothetical protein [Deltaproteobacteria bacterium]MCW5803767.1 hypothetical protein [Deltaproteobacteria bacterium]
MRSRHALTAALAAAIAFAVACGAGSYAYLDHRAPVAAMHLAPLRTAP